ncbi:MAG: 50S ribosomal protein L19 [Aquificaceae bacterium]
MSSLIYEVERRYKLKRNFPKFMVGDTVKVYYKIVEGDKERVQPFEGIVMKIKGGGINKSFTIRKESYGVGIERIFPYSSPNIEKIELIKHGKVRRAKLYFLRKYKGKEAAGKIREIRAWEKKK